MHITRIEVGKTVPVGNEKNATYLKAMLGADLEYGDDTEICKKDLMVQVDNMISQMNGDGPTPAKTSSLSRRATTSEETTTEEKPAPKRTRRSAAKTEAQEEPAEDTTEAKTAPRRQRKAAKTAPKKAPKSKITTYDRTNQDHKAEVKKILNENYEGWDKDDEFKVASKAASEKVTGVDFIDADGNVMQSFIDTFLDAVDAEQK